MKYDINVVQLIINLYNYIKNNEYKKMYMSK